MTDWCNRFEGGAAGCKKSVNTSKCSSGVATLASYQGGVGLNGCYYFHFAQYKCAAGDLRLVEAVDMSLAEAVDVSLVEESKDTSSSAEQELLSGPTVQDWDLVAYNDMGSCGARGNDQHMTDWCNRFEGGAAGCKKSVNTSKCSSGVATLASYQGGVSLNGCYYFHFAQYGCQ